MIAAWMLYCIGIGLAFGLGGRAAEWACYLAGRPIRWAWSAALLGTLLLPVAAALRPNLFGSIAVPLAPLPAHASASPPGSASVPASESEHGVTWADFDSGLRWGWGLSSVTLVLVLGVAAARLAALRRSWRLSLVDERSVFIADDVGPAVAGLWSPRIVIPAWALQLPESQRRLMLVHEEEHVRARDPWLLAAGTAALVLAPWNPVLWWLVRRLRLAVEMDCDARVVGRGHSTPEYGELLLQVGQHRAHLPLTAAALGEPGSFLERRIRRLAAQLPRRRWLSAATSVVVATASVVAACEAPRPVASEVQEDRAQGDFLLQHPDPFIPGQAFLREVAMRYHPEVFAHPRKRSGSGYLGLQIGSSAIALVFDSKGRVLGHAAGVRELRDADCLAVVKRLVPAFTAVGPPGGCADAGEHPGEIVVYWISASH
ncbi:MAG TPA: M56 family metallopeptidase [Gemmatimonadales bacterium]|nr:M56 family metallopeptidase [Gemmatimonadales bacterium]